jgi:hypothetical protein
MELTPTRVEEALRRWVGDDGRASVTGTIPGSRLTGYVAHPAFRGLSVRERQALLWNGDTQWEGLNRLFGDEATQIGVIFTYSLEEFDDLFGGETDVA